MSNGTYCIVIHCNSNKRQQPECAFFTLPKNIETAKKWIQICGRSDLLVAGHIPTQKDYRVCSNHFSAEQFKKTYPRKLLKANSYPCLDCPFHTDPLNEKNLSQSSSNILVQNIDIAKPAANEEVFENVDKRNLKKTARHPADVDDPSENQLVEEYELLKNLNSYDLHVPLFGDEQTINFRSHEPGQSSVSPTLEKDIDLENCNHENQYGSEIIPTPDGYTLEKQCMTVNQSDGFDTPVPQPDRRFKTVIETFVNRKMEKPYFKSVKSFLQDCNRLTEVCRICFQSLEEEEVIKLYGQSSQQDPVQLKNLLKLVLPGLDLEIYPNTVICVKCAELLVYSYQLKEKWLSTEEKLKKLIEKKKAVINRDADLVIIGKRVEKVDKKTVKIDHSYARSLQHEEPSELEMTDALLESLALDSKEKCISQKVSIFHGNLNSNNLVSVSQFRRGRPPRLRKEKREKMPDLGPYMCEQCGHTFMDRKKLIRHLKTHNNPQTNKVSYRERTIMCEICGQLFTTFNRLQIHKQIHAENKCTFCERVFNRKAHLNNHITSKHLCKSYQCHVCGKRYSYRTSLALHMKVHNPASKTKACHICDKKFLYPTNLKNHLSRHIKERLLKCDYCGKSLKYACSLEKHIQIYHLNEAKYVCEFCNKPYWKKCDLEKHRLRIHQSLHVEQEPSEVFNEENCAVNSIQQISTLER